MLKKSLLRIFVVSSLVLSITAFSAGDGGRGPAGGGGHNPGGGHGPSEGGNHGPSGGGDHGHGHWGGWGSGGRALFWTDFGLEVGALVLGTVVMYLPPERTVVYVDRAPYYYYAGTYFSTAPGGVGYVVVNPPPVVVQAPPTTVIVQAPARETVVVQPAPPAVVKQQQAPPPADPPDQGTASKPDSGKYDIYLPNGNGTFTLIPLTKTATGFMGPQGEFYPDHPTLEQLTERYMKK